VDGRQGTLTGWPVRDYERSSSPKGSQPRYIITPYWSADRTVGGRLPALLSLVSMTVSLACLWSAKSAYALAALGFPAIVRWPCDTR
jgi:hypothetical protein